ncbi:dnaJ homolog subfamily C member 8 [Pelobates cultripes]|uniref:DnaJ homolog subfamily C member 8 n=1 Tax=Pelobates cultripes TaxID=61616 RepID=A0AAD1R134_PELCU|nr:dnaJ homolog subfamily C member 8 [Pelobates cultripes]
MILPYGLPTIGIACKILIICNNTTHSRGERNRKSTSSPDIDKRARFTHTDWLEMSSENEDQVYVPEELDGKPIDSFISMMISAPLATYSLYHSSLTFHRGHSLRSVCLSLYPSLKCYHPSQCLAIRYSNTFYAEVKQIEKRDSVLTSKQQIDRLIRPGSSYFNLNPFEVLQIDPEVTDDEIKKRFRQLSILVHPDKNQDDPERAQKAFEAVDKAYKCLLDPEQKKRALDVIQAGQEYVEHIVKERKKQLKKEGKSLIVEEDDPEVFKQAVYKQTMKLFAELEIKRKEREAKEMHERKRQREEEIETQEKAKRDREWQKNFEESRDGRVDSWRNFQANTKGKKKEKKARTFLKPPKVKMEQRE